MNNATAEDTAKLEELFTGTGALWVPVAPGAIGLAEHGVASCRYGLSFVPKGYDVEAVHPSCALGDSTCANSRAAHRDRSADG